MVTRTLLRLAARVPGVPSDLADWYEHARRVAVEAEQEHRKYMASGHDDTREPSRWLQEPRDRKPIRREKRDGTS